MEDQEIAVRIGRRIRDLRKERNLHQEQLAEKAKLAGNTVSRIEAGRYRPSVLTTVKIAKALGVDPGEIFRGITTDLKDTTPTLKSRTQEFGEPEVRSQVEGAGGIPSEEAFGVPHVYNKVTGLFRKFRDGKLTLDQLEQGVLSYLEESA